MLRNPKAKSGRRSDGTVPLNSPSFSAGSVLPAKKIYNLPSGISRALGLHAKAAFGEHLFDADTGIGDVVRNTLTAAKEQSGPRNGRRLAMGVIARLSACLTLVAWAQAASAQTGAGEHSVTVADLPQDLSPWGMFLHADTIVKTVMIGLAVASLVTWTIWVAKSIELYGARAKVRRGLRVLTEAATLAQAHEQLRKATGPIAHLMQVAASEIRFSANLRADGLKERIAWQLERIEMAAGRKISRGTGVLATIGATAPFVGLFGTVWGIMDSFIDISKAHTTNLAVVAPGIAEALLATALGLVAAIPAVMIYNVLARSTAHYRALIGDASAQVMKLVSRDLDRGKAARAEIMTQAAE
jgi:biopolymer transport protein ExbB